MKTMDFPVIQIKQYDWMNEIGCEALILCEFDSFKICMVVVIGSMKSFICLFLLLGRELNDEVVDWNDIIV